jgi:hypothetical protein
MGFVETISVGGNVLAIIVRCSITSPGISFSPLEKAGENDFD